MAAIAAAAEAEAAAANNRKSIIIKNCAPFSNCMSEINNTQIVMLNTMRQYNLIKHSDNYSETSGILRHYHRDEPFLNANGAIADVPADNNNV